MQNIHDTSLKDFVNKDGLQNQKNGLCIAFAQNKAATYLLTEYISSLIKDFTVFELNKIPEAKLKTKRCPTYLTFAIEWNTGNRTLNQSLAMNKAKANDKTFSIKIIQATLLSGCISFKLICSKCCSMLP